jgi:hypothetical protein
MDVENGRMKGNYSACVLLKNEPEDQADALKKKFGPACESWWPDSIVRIPYQRRIMRMLESKRH